MSLVNKLFNPIRKKIFSKYYEMGTFQSTFSRFGNNSYNSMLMRACVRPLADYTSKAVAYCENEAIAKLLNNRPNMYMSGPDFLKKVRERYEILNAAFIYIRRNDSGKVIEFYPVPYDFFEAVEYNDELYIKFYFDNAETPELVLPWADLVGLRREYLNSDIGADDNRVVLKTLELLDTVDQGTANAIKSTANLKGILKSKIAMLAPEDVKKNQEEFIRNYINLENHSGIAALDSSQDFIPITINPYVVNSATRKDIRDDLYRYMGVNDKILMGDIKSEELENFYHLNIEPFLNTLSRGLTNKVFAGKAEAYEKNRIIYMTDQGEFMTIGQKIEMFSKVVLYGGMLTDEWRKFIGLGHIEGGDTPIRRLDADFINGDSKPRKGNESVDSENEENE